jgi:uncharacterized protein YejL (UPF0352 family)
MYFLIYSVETSYGINSATSKLMTPVENAETGQFLSLIVVGSLVHDVIHSRVMTSSAIFLNNNPHFFLLFLIDLPTT